jgi:hypothetical protein
VSEVAGLIELLDLRLHCIVISPHYGDATDNEMLVEMKDKAEADREDAKEKMDANTKLMQEKMDANMKTMQEKADGDRKADREELKGMINALQENMDAWIANIRDDREERTSCQETTEPCLECEEPISADIKSCQETTACHEATEANMEKIQPDPGMMQSVDEQQEVPKEDAVVKPVRGRKKRHRDRKLIAGRREEPKKLTRGYCASRKRVTVASRRNVSRHARVEWRKKNFQENWDPKNWSTDKVEREARRAQMLRRRVQSRQEGARE